MSLTAWDGKENSVKEGGLRAATAARNPYARRRVVRLRRPYRLNRRNEAAGFTESEAFELILRGLADPCGWLPLADELRGAAFGLFDYEEAERRRRRFSPEAWARLPGKAALYARLRAEMDGHGPEAV